MSRPQSLLAKLQIEAGAKGITCQKLGEAEVMAQAGIDDILISYNLIGDEKMARLGALLAKTNVTVTADNPVVIADYRLRQRSWAQCACRDRGAHRPQACRCRDARGKSLHSASQDQDTRPLVRRAADVPHRNRLGRCAEVS